MKVLVSAAHALVGAVVVQELRRQGHDVATITRTENGRAMGDYLFDPSSGYIEPGALEGRDAVVHLGGWASLHSRRWSASRRRDILNSRLDRTRAIAQAFVAARQPPPVLISESTVGIYGDRGDEDLSEESEPGSGFLAHLGVAWEETSRLACDAGTRVVILRMGEVLAPRGGILPRHIKRFRLGLGGRLGHGAQWMSWTTLPDVVTAITHSIQDERISGAVNVTSPTPVTNAHFTAALAAAVKRPSPVPAPPIACRALLGRGRADELVLASRRALPVVLASTGFSWRHPTLEPALSYLVRPAAAPAENAKRRPGSPGAAR